MYYILNFFFRAKTVITSHFVCYNVMKAVKGLTFTGTHIEIVEEWKKQKVVET